MAAPRPGWPHQLTGVSELAAARPGAPRRVLAVEDEPSLLHFYTRTLEAGGHEVVACESGEEALAALGRGRFDLLLTDLRMPGMSGLQLLRASRAYDLDLPALIVTASPDLQTAVEAVEEGALQYLIKPVRREQLEAAVDRAISLGLMSRLKRQALALLQERGAEPGDKAGATTALNDALATLDLAWQPVVDLRRRTVFGYEALLRCEGVLSTPPLVLAAAERLRRLTEVGRAVREKAANALPGLGGGASILVNLHPLDLLDEDLLSADSPLAAEAGRVVLEITERALLEGVSTAPARIAQLRRLGFRIAVDDLGAGYAGLSSFALLEPDIVKLDMSLVRDIERAPTKQTLVKAMIDVCTHLGVVLIAEGIETAAERDALVSLGCSLMQGFFFARPGAAFPPAAL